MYNFANDVISTMGVMLCAFYLFTKVLNLKAAMWQKVSAILWCLLLAVIYAFNPFLVSELTTRPIFCIASTIFILIISREKIDTNISAFLVSYGISYIFYYISIVVISLIVSPFEGRNHQAGSIIDFNAPVYLLIFSMTFIFQFLLSYLFFRIRRFKKGFSFLLERYAIIIALIIAGSVMVIATLISIIGTTEDVAAIPLLFVSLLTIGAGIYIWIRRAIKALQLRWFREQNEDILTKENEELKAEIERIKTNQETIRTANHNINHRLRSVERNYMKMLIKLSSYDELAEINEELMNDLENVLLLKEDYLDSISGEQVNFSLSSTHVKAIDDLINYFASRCNKKDIEFRIKVNGSIIYMIENIISQNKLEILIGDLLEDAIIAVMANDISARRFIYALIGEADGCYEFSVHDTGIPFTIDTLTRLGSERVTTHESSGGSGIGFMKTFETKRECAASLIITENQPNTAFTKSIAFRFDQKNDYIIKSYRAEEFPPGEGYKVAEI
ncbi:MAG: hypothetical protein FWE14_06065 [Lachnospiraceae bacterium]|nr:hypothetical protein [Lachnospiraceae bacterium]